MPWFVTPRVRFLHVPKTGGSWATDAMCAAGVAAMHPEPSPAHATLADSEAFSDRFTFAFIRHPLDYWRSYWGYRMRTGWDATSAVDREAGSDRFEEFIEGVIAVAPGAATRLFEQFVGSAENEIAFVGRFERLVDDVCFALRIAGEHFDESRLRAYPAVNANDYDAREARYPRSLAVALADVERDGIERFYPWDPVPDELLTTPRRVAPSSEHAEQLAAVTIQLRDARAELGQARYSLRGTELARLEAQRALELVQNSRLQRWTRSPRRLWYDSRRVAGHFLAGAPAIAPVASGALAVDVAGRMPEAAADRDRTGTASE